MKFKSSISTPTVVMVTILGILHLTDGFRLPRTYDTHHRRSGSKVYSGDKGKQDTSSLVIRDKISKATNFQTLLGVLDVLNENAPDYPQLNDNIHSFMKDRRDLSFSNILNKPEDIFQTNRPVHIPYSQMLLPLRQSDVVGEEHRGRYAQSSDISERDGFRVPNAIATSKRRVYNCDMSNVTLNTLIEYLRSRKICGYRVSHVRFGLGRK